MTNQCQEPFAKLLTDWRKFPRFLRKLVELICRSAKRANPVDENFSNQVRMVKKSGNSKARVSTPQRLDCALFVPVKKKCTCAWPKEGRKTPPVVDADWFHADEGVPFLCCKRRHVLTQHTGGALIAAE